MGVELPDIPGNSLKDRADRKIEEKKDIEVKPLELRGNVEVKKRGLGARLGEALLPEDISATKENIWKRIIIPSIKDLIVDAIEEFFLGGSRGGRGKGYKSPLDKPSYVNYVDYSKGGDRDRRDQQRSTSERDFDYRQIYFGVAEDATDCLHDMVDMLDQYKAVTIGNLYDILRKPTNPSLFDFGWRSLRDAQIVKERNGGATLYLPRATPLN